MKQTLSSETRGSPPESTQMPGEVKKNYAFSIFVVLLAVTILNEIDNAVFSSASTRIANNLHLGINDIGFLSSAFTLAVTLSIIPVGIWADRAKRKHVIAACLAVWSLATTCTALASNFLALFVARTVVGGGEAGYVPASNALVGDLFGVASRAKVLSWLATG
ncbi:MAG: MFS transporter, partial [Chloroflexota bacterium]|nr:MFS transporter [Chloroflexota bacterium]